MAELQPPEGQINGGAQAMTSSENVASKRQRRPSVRLGDIGDQTYDLQLNRRTKQWKMPLRESAKSSKTRAVMTLGGSGEYHEALDGEEREGNLDSVAIGSWKVKDWKSKRASTMKRVRSNWASGVDEGGGGGGGGEGDEKFSAGEDVDDGFRDSESPLKEQSPIQSLDNRRAIRARYSEGRGHHDGIELDLPSDTDARNWNSSERDGVRVWLNQLGLGRYAPVFEIHEVDDEVLPLLTLDDLRDMGINAVGSRRKMYCAIQKLGKGFS